MALASGTRLGPYAITVQIGVGGMGEVSGDGYARGGDQHAARGVCGGP